MLRLFAQGLNNNNIDQFIFYRKVPIVTTPETVTSKVSDS